MIEEAHRRQTSFVRRNPVHRVSDNAAHHALFECDLLAAHKFAPDNTVIDEAKTDEVIDDGVLQAH